jgi:hypothetical protein
MRTGESPTLRNRKGLAWGRRDLQPYSPAGPYH